MSRAAWCVLAALMLTAPAAAQDPPHPADQTEGPVISDVTILGASVYTRDELARRHGLTPGVRLSRSPEALAAEIQKRYASEGYVFAEVRASIDPAGVLTIEIDEGQIDAIEFRGVSAELAARLSEAFAVQPGEVFNRPHASRALDEALRITQGAVFRYGQTFSLSRDEGRRVLQVLLRTRGQRSGVFFGTQGREDFYSPVDGFAPALGFQSTVFDADAFNHTYIGGYVSYKFAAERVGWTFGIERPFFADGVLQVGGSIQDLTASDDRWRLSDVEQSLVAFGFRNTFRDYYRRKGFQLHAVVRPLAAHEWLVAWRDEWHGALANETNWGLFRGDHEFRSNSPAQDGDLRALIVGYTFDSAGLLDESPAERYHRHQADDLFGAAADRDRGARVEWRSEIAPAAFDHDFDFSRHILNARAWRQFAPGRLLSGRLLTGFSDGTLPPQRVFALGGIGTVHGYRFKAASGAHMVLANAEFRQRLGRRGPGGLVFLDLGRVYDPLPGSTGEWLKGVGVGLDMGGSRLEFGWRLDDIPRSLQVLFRLGPTF